MQPYFHNQRVSVGGGKTMMGVSSNRCVDLRSDTVTRPSSRMRDAMARAAVGDDVFGEDPTVNELQEQAAALFGKEAALFVPSGTMANLLAVLAQTRPGDAIILSDDAHPFNYESGNLAMVAGVMTRTIHADKGILTAEQIAGQIIQTDDHHFAPTTWISIENTSNRGGGAIYPIETVAEIGALARTRGLRLHCDGARIFNAVVETGVSAATYASHVDTISFCLSKGLGCPVGSLLVGDRETIRNAHRFRKMLGGGMRQAGFLAAAGLYALAHHIDRLQEDHQRARWFRSQLEGMPGIDFPLPSPTNMVYLQVADAQAITQQLAERGVLVYLTGPATIRTVFHLDVNNAGAERAAEAFRAVLQ
jgi:threonine aldolase